MVVGHREAGQVAGVAEGGELLLGHLPATLRRLGNDVRRHQVNVVHYFGQRVLGVA